MNLRFYIIIIVAFCSLAFEAQVPFTDYINPFPQTYLSMNYNSYASVEKDNDNIYMLGQMNLWPREYGFIFKRKNDNGNSNVKVYYCNPQTRLTSFVINKNFKHYFAFQNTDADVGCSSAGLKITNYSNMMRLDFKNGIYFVEIQSQNTQTKTIKKLVINN